MTMQAHLLEIDMDSDVCAASPFDQCIVVILTYNSDAIIAETLNAASQVSPNVFVVDSFSSDRTCEIAQSFGCEIIQHKFINYSQQRNWAISQVAERFQWQLHLDADEVLDSKAIEGIKDVLRAGSESASAAYLLWRRDYFMNKELRFSGLNPWHLRLFISGHGRCEDRLYDQHFLSDLPSKRLPGLMHDKNSVSLSEWTVRHNRWSDLEAQQIERNIGKDELQPAMFGDPRQRVRLLKWFYYALPSGLRSIMYFVYRYLFRGGFLDGQVGFYFALFQGLWFRALVDAKEFERVKSSKGAR